MKTGTRQHGLESDIIFSARYYNVLDGSGSSRDKYRDFQKKMSKLIDYDSANLRLSEGVQKLFKNTEKVKADTPILSTELVVSVGVEKEARFLSRKEHFQIKIRNNKLQHKCTISAKFKRNQLFVYYRTFQPCMGQA